MDPKASSSSVSGGRLPDCLCQDQTIKENGTVQDQRWQNQAD